MYGIHFWRGSLSKYVPPTTAGGVGEVMRTAVMGQAVGYSGGEAVAGACGREGGGCRNEAGSGGQVVGGRREEAGILCLVAHPSLQPQADLIPPSHFSSSLLHATTCSLRSPPPSLLSPPTPPYFCSESAPSLLQPRTQSIAPARPFSSGVVLTLLF